MDEPDQTLAVDDAVLVFRRGEFVVALNLSGEAAERPAGRVVLSTLAASPPSSCARTRASSAPSR